MSGIDTFVSNNINNDFGELDNTPDNDYDKNRIHVETRSKKPCKRIDCILYHDQPYRE